MTPLSALIATLPSASPYGATLSGAPFFSLQVPSSARNFCRTAVGLVASVLAAACGWRPLQALARWLRQAQGYVLRGSSARCGSACPTSTGSECLAADQLVLPYRQGRGQAVAGRGYCRGSECASTHCPALCLAPPARARFFSACRRFRALLICVFWHNSFLAAATAHAGLPASCLELQAGPDRPM